MEVNSTRTGILPNEWGEGKGMKDVCEGEVMKNDSCGAEASKGKGVERWRRMGR